MVLEESIEFLVCAGDVIFYLLWKKMHAEELELTYSKFIWHEDFCSNTYSQYVQIHT